MLRTPYIIKLKKYSLLILLLITGLTSKAQLTPLADMYYQNQYLGNPAMAGVDQGLRLNVALRQQWSNVPGTPKTHSLTADYGMEGKVGLGINIQNDEAGLIKRTGAMGTYAYHLPLNKDMQKLHFGVSLGFTNSQVMNEIIDGEQNDASLGRYGQRKTYLDGDFGVAYTANKLTLQASLPNMKSLFEKNDGFDNADRATFYSAASYRFYFPEALDGAALEPKVAFRGISGYDNIVDIGANFSMANKAANIMAIYHSTKSATIGIGVKIKNIGGLTAAYTTSTAAQQDYMNGYFQLGLQISFLK